MVTEQWQCDFKNFTLLSWCWWIESFMSHRGFSLFLGDRAKKWKWESLSQIHRSLELDETSWVRLWPPSTGQERLLGSSNSSKMHVQSPFGYLQGMCLHHSCWESIPDSGHTNREEGLKLMHEKHFWFVSKTITFHRTKQIGFRVLSYTLLGGKTISLNLILVSWLISKDIEV